MSALKVLDELDGRLAAASGGKWELSTSGTGVTSAKLPDDWLIACQLRPGDAAMIARAPADLALLSRIVRTIASVPCESAEYEGRDCPTMMADIERVALNGRGKEAAESWAVRSGCWPCRIRRELGGGR